MTLKNPKDAIPPTSVLKELERGAAEKDHSPLAGGLSGGLVKDAEPPPPSPPPKKGEDFKLVLDEKKQFYRVFESGQRERVFLVPKRGLRCPKCKTRMKILEDKPE